MKKRIISLLCALVLGLGLCACENTPLPEGFDQDEVLAQAEQVVDLMEARDYERVSAMFSEELLAELDAEALEAAADEFMVSLGDFVKVATRQVMGQKDDILGDYAVVIIVCEYANDSASYTVSIDSDGKVCGLYVG